MDEQRTAPPPRKRRRGLKIFGTILGIIVLLLVVAYFVGTSEGFVKSVILPRVSKSMNATITTEHASISPFSHVRFQNLKVVTTGNEPLLSAQDVDATYSLMKIIRGDIAVQKVELVSPVIQIVQNADGTSNLDPFTKANEKERKGPSKESKESKPPRVNVQQVELRNATVRQIKHLKGGGQDSTEISNLNMTLNNLQNGQSGKMQVGANVAVNNQTPETNATMQAKLNGNFDFALKQDLGPASLKGAMELSVQNAGGSLQPLSGVAANLTADLTPTDIRQLALKLQQSGNAVGEIRAQGPFDSSKMEGKVRVEIASIDRKLLNLVGAGKGLDFGSTTIDSTNQIEMAKGGALITTSGRMEVAKMTVKKGEQVTPVLELYSAYHVTVDRDANSANIQTLDLTGLQAGRQLLRGQLTAPMKVSWGDATPAPSDSAFNLAITGLNLADWKPFLGDVAPAGVIGVNLKVTSQQSGKLLAFDTSSDLQNLSVVFGSNVLSNVGGTLTAQGTAADLKKFDLANYKLNLTQQNQPMLNLSGGGQYDNSSKSADMRVVLDGALPGLIKLAGETNASASSGKLGLNGRITKSGEAETVTGTLSLADFTGRYGSYRFDRFGSTMDLDVTVQGKQLQIRKADGKVTSGANSGGAFSVAGNYNLKDRKGQFDLKLADFNQNGLRPFLESMLHEKKLQSVSLNSTASARLDGSNAAVKANFQLANLVVVDPKNPTRQPALEAGLTVDAAMENKVLELRQVQANLTPTQKAKNQLQVTGRIDTRDSNAITGNIKLAAEALDVTRYYDLFSGSSAEEQAKAAPANPTTPSPGETTAPSQPQKEPDPVNLPVKNFVVDANIGRLYLRELEITNFQTNLKLDRSAVTIDPLRLAVNGAPVTSKITLDLSVAGYRYDVNFDAQRIPIEPIANSFAPQKRGMYKGELVSQMKVTGAGVTGSSMKKSLSGQLGLNFTNANIQIVNPQLRGFLMPIAAFLQAPELLDSPVNQLLADAHIGNGKISVTQLRLISEAFVAESKGDVNITDELMQSTFEHWPMHLSLRRSLAQKVRIAPQNTPENQPYVALPDFIQVTGTLKSPKPKLDLNTRAIAGTVLDKLGGKLPADQGGNIVQGLSHILGGGSNTNRPAVTNQSTNAPSNTATNANRTNAPGGFNPLDLLDQFKKKK